jgi:hypothetical protein
MEGVFAMVDASDKLTAAAAAVLRFAELVVLSEQLRLHMPPWQVPDHLLNDTSNFN